MSGFIGLLLLFAPPLVVLWLANLADARAPVSPAQAAPTEPRQVAPLGSGAASEAISAVSPAGWPDGRDDPG